MANASHPYVISYDASEALPYGFAWFANLGNDIRGGSGFTFFATRNEVIEYASKHVRYTNPVCIDDESPEAN